MNVNQLRERFTKLSIDQLVVLLDQYADEPTVESRMIEEVLAQKIGVMANEVKLPRIEEEAGDATLCPPPIQAPSGAAFESVSRDINSTEAHVDMFSPELKPSPAPRWIPDHVPAVPSADVVGVAPIHKDGTQSNTFVGDVQVLPGVKISFNNPGRSA
jgi:hypothetical protein